MTATLAYPTSGMRSSTRGIIHTGKRVVKKAYQSKNADVMYMKNFCLLVHYREHREAKAAVQEHSVDLLNTGTLLACTWCTAGEASGSAAREAAGSATREAARRTTCRVEFLHNGVGDRLKLLLPLLVLFLRRLLRSIEPRNSVVDS